MRKLFNINPLVRAVGVISAVAVLVGGVTFAALQSRATLTNNTISTASAGLEIWDGNSFENTAPGFDVTGLVPGRGSGENFFYLRNSGDADMNVTARVPRVPDRPNGGYGFSGWENVRVTFVSHEAGCSNDTVRTTMATLLAREVRLPCGPLSEGARGDANNHSAEGTYSVAFDINPAAVSGERAQVGDFDIRFTGTAVNNDDSGRDRNGYDNDRNNDRDHRNRDRNDDDDRDRRNGDRDGNDNRRRNGDNRNNR